MSDTKAGITENTKFLLTGAEKRPAPPQVFTGDTRLKALGLLASAIVEKRVVAAMQLLNKDPSLAFEKVRWATVTGESWREEDVGIVELCALNSMPCGYVFAIHNGFDPNASLSDGLNLIEHAVRRGSSAELSILLSLGASVEPRPLDELNHGLMHVALIDALVRRGNNDPKGLDLSIVNMLLDAGAPVKYPTNAPCPLNILVQYKYWGVEDVRRRLTKLMVRLAHHGANLDEPTGLPKMPPILRALGSKNGAAIAALIAAGVDVSPKALGGRELLVAMDSQGLQDYVPQVTEALMARRVAQAKANAASAGAAADSAEATGAQEPQRQRRRMGAL